MMTIIGDQVQLVGVQHPHLTTHVHAVLRNQADKWSRIMVESESILTISSEQLHSGSS